MKRVHVAKNGMEAHFLRTLLEEHGIEAVVQNEMLGQARGDLPLDDSTAPVVCVLDDARADEAVRLAEEMGREAVGRAWRCPGCGERNGPAFEFCWSCGRPAAG